MFLCIFIAFLLYGTNCDNRSWGQKYLPQKSVYSSSNISLFIYVSVGPGGTEMRLSPSKLGFVTDLVRQFTTGFEMI